LRQFNRRRLLNGLAALARNAALDRAAQRHADDLARRSSISLVGSDGSDTTRRVIESGFREWPGNRRTATELVFRGASFDEALDFLLADVALRRTLFDRSAREVGFGATKNGPATSFSIIVGAQPNVLPIFVNDGASTTNSSEVTIRLSQEEINTDTENGAISRVVDVRLGSEPTFQGAAWVAFEPLIPFSLKGPGENTVYAEFRDAVGRRVTSNAVILFDPAAKPEPAIGLGEPIGTEAQDDPAATVTPVPSPTKSQPLIAVATLANAGSRELTPATPNVVEATPVPAFPGPTLAPLPGTPVPPPAGTATSSIGGQQTVPETGGGEIWQWLLIAQAGIAGLILVRVLRGRR
jgi:hypothetical protein